MVSEEVVVIAVIVVKFGPQLDVVLWLTRARFLCLKFPFNPLKLSLTTETGTQKELGKFCKTSIFES